MASTSNPSVCSTNWVRPNGCRNLALSSSQGMRNRCGSHRWTCESTMGKSSVSVTAPADGFRIVDRPGVLVELSPHPLGDREVGELERAVLRNGVVERLRHAADLGAAETQ